MAGGATKDIDRSGDAVERAYGALRSMLAKGALPPGAHLREEGLAAEIGVSRTPVREAIRRLGAEGWLDIVRNQGAFVRAWSRQDVEETLSLRALLEGVAAKFAATHASAAQVSDLKMISAESLARLPCANAQDVAEIETLNNRFHRLVWEASRQVRTAAILTNLLELPVTYSYFKSLAPEDMERSLREHATLADAIAARDPEWAGRLMEAHIHGGKRLFLDRAPRDGAQP